MHINSIKQPRFLCFTQKNQRFKHSFHVLKIKAKNKSRNETDRPHFNPDVFRVKYNKVVEFERGFLKTAEMEGQQD